jgi:hypothetical protein
MFSSVGCLQFCSHHIVLSDGTIGSVLQNPHILLITKKTRDLRFLQQQFWQLNSSSMIPDEKEQESRRLESHVRVMLHRMLSDCAGTISWSRFPKRDGFYQILQNISSEFPPSMNVPRWNIQQITKASLDSWTYLSYIKSYSPARSYNQGSWLHR